MKIIIFLTYTIYSPRKVFPISLHCTVNYKITNPLYVCLLDQPTLGHDKALMKRQTQPLTIHTFIRIHLEFIWFYFSVKWYIRYQVISALQYIRMVCEVGNVVRTYCLHSFCACWIIPHSITVWICLGMPVGYMRVIRRENCTRVPALVEFVCTG